MPETTPTAASAHLVTHEHGRAIDTHLHEPAPARMPITLEGDEPPDCWQWITDMKDAAIDIAKLLFAVAIVAGLAGLAYRFLTN